jgi:hypothetical protein
VDDLFQVLDLKLGVIAYDAEITQLNAIALTWLWWLPGARAGVAPMWPPSSAP